MTNPLPPRPAAAPAPPATAELCDVCSHPLDSHDGIGLRFCSATSANALSRACLCRYPK